MMISVSSDDAVEIKIGDTAYLIDDEDSYRNLLIVITDPNPDIQFSDELFTVDPEIQSQNQIEIATRYSEFFKAYVKKREQKIEERKAAIKDGILACSESTEALLSDQEEPME